MMVTYNNKTFFKRASFLLAFFYLCLNAKAQNAKELFSNYWKVGITGNRVTYYSANQANSVNYRLYNVNVFDVGLTWNFYQKGNHNFKASVVKPQPYYEKTTLNIKLEDLPLLENNGTTYYDYTEEVLFKSSNAQWKMNVLYEYFIPLNQTAYLSAAIGSEVLYYPKIRAAGSLSIGNYSTGEEITLVTEATERVHDINLGLKGEVSTYFATKIGLLQFKINALIGLNNYQETELNTLNLLVSPPSTSKHVIKGHYIGFGVTYYIKRKKK